MGREDLKRVVVLSDLHFGEDGTLLTRPDVIEALLAELRGLGEIDVMVLLGDAWDLWRTGTTTAFSEGAPFFQALATWDGSRETVFVAGNHDFHLWAFSEEARLRRRLGWEETGELAIVLSRGSASRDRIWPVEGFSVRLHYPFLSLEVGGRRVLFMHGHHLDFFSRSFWWAKTSWLARWILGRSRGIALSDLDRLNKPFFELLTATAHVPELRSWEYRFYAIMRFFARLLRFESKSGGSPRRYTSVRDNTAETRDMFLEFLPGYIPDLFVFGHTHRAGLGRIKLGGRPVILANCGCWLEGSGSETSMTYLVVDEDIRLRRLGDWEVTARSRP